MLHLARPLDGAEVNALLDHLPEGRQLAKLVDSLDDLLNNVVDLLRRCEAANTEAETRVCVLVVQTKRAKHVARLERSGRASRAGGEADILERHQERLALDVLE